MTMNKLGFTLIELLSSITIMGLIAAITSFNMVGIFEEKKKMQEETQNSLMTTAAYILN